MLLDCGECLDSHQLFHEMINFICKIQNYMEKFISKIIELNSRKRMKLDTYFYHAQKIILKLIRVLIAKTKSVKLVKENIGKI